MCQCLCAGLSVCCRSEKVGGVRSSGSSCILSPSRLRKGQDREGGGGQWCLKRNKRIKMGCVCLVSLLSRKNDMMDVKGAANIRQSFPILSTDGGSDPS